MLEAVNSVLSNASYTKAIADQQSVVTSYAANPERVQQASLQAPYISLYIKMDTNFDKAILQIRDSDTGDVVRQIPTESQLEAYRRAQTSNAVREPEPKEAADAFTPTQPQSQETTPQKTSAPVVSTPTPTPAPSYQPEAVSAAPAPTPAPVSIDTQA